MKMLFRFSSVPAALCLVLLSACGGKSPISPSETAQSGQPVAPGGTAIVTGSVRGGSVSALASGSTGNAISGLTVSVPGTSLSSVVDAGGGFSLVGVPAGDVQLRFSGAGVDARLSLPQVREAETITLVVSVSGTTATVESQRRSSSSSAELEGRIEALPPTMPAGALRVAGQTVRTDASTRIREGSVTRTFAFLAVGMRVEVEGTSTGGEILASSIDIEDTDTDDADDDDADDDDDGDDDDDSDDDDDDGDQDESASIHGELTAKTGSIPQLTLTVGGTRVLTTAETTVKRRGDVQTLAALQLGQTLHVVGERKADASLVARKIEINDDEEDGAFEIEGPAGGLTGTCPAIRFTVNGFSIRATTSTVFEDGPCSGIKSGTKVEVKGTRNADGSVTATRIETKK